MMLPMTTTDSRDMETPLGWRDEWRRVDSRWGPMIVNRFDQYIGWSFLAYGEFSPDEVKFLQSLVSPGDVVVDAGANLGAIAIPLAQKVGPTGRILCFEPQPRVFELLALNRMQTELDCIDARMLAVGSAPGELVLPELDYGHPNNFGGVSLQREGAGIRIPVEPIDAFRLSSVRLLKIDVEGMEREVLEGARDTIERCRPLLYVENDRPEKSEALIALIEELDYGWQEHRPMLYSSTNHFKNPNDLFPTIASWNLYCEPR